jgi:hypothetical protein
MNIFRKIFGSEQVSTTPMSKTNRSQRVREVQLEDRWAVGEGHTPDGLPYICRWRTPVLAPPNVDGYDQVLKVVWPYADEDTGAMPSDQDSQAMEAFEDRLISAWEHDGHAYLAAILTMDGARQWVFYTSDIEECAQRLTDMPQERDPYPLEFTTDFDPDWSWLHNQILSPFDLTEGASD